MAGTQPDALGIGSVLLTGKRDVEVASIIVATRACHDTAPGNESAAVRVVCHSDSKGKFIKHSDITSTLVRTRWAGTGSTLGVRWELPPDADLIHINWEQLTALVARVGLQNKSRKFDELKAQVADLLSKQCIEHTAKLIADAIAATGLGPRTFKPAM